MSAPMKTTILVFALASVILHPGLYGQGVNHPWHVVDNGGGASTAGGVVLRASIGQPAIAVMSSTGANLEGGYIPALRYFSGAASILDVTIESGWNMVSVPLIVPDALPSILYPTGNSKAFTYQGSFVIRDTLKVGAGYWIKFFNAGRRRPTLDAA